MDDDFFEEEEEESVFGDDEVFDYIMFDEMEKKGKPEKNSRCLTSVLLIFSANIDLAPRITISMTIES